MSYLKQCCDSLAMHFKNYANTEHSEVLRFLYLLGDIIVNHNVSVTQNKFSVPYKNIPEKNSALKIIQRDL